MSKPNAVAARVSPFSYRRMCLAENYFEIFDLPLAFDVDLSLLAERYRGVQRVLHPDKYVNSGERERRLSVQAATRVNDAYNMLKSPLLRAKYMLGLRGVDIDKTEAKPLELAFLMEQMDLRESLAAAKDLAALSALEREIACNWKDAVDRLGTLLAEPARLDSSVAVDLVRKLQFFEKLRDEAHSRAAALELEDEHP